MDFFNFLSHVSKPTRYIGNEFNAIQKTWGDVQFRIALAYPDLYEIGMSNLALKILYGILNNRSDILAERVFNPWPDAEQKMRESEIPLFSLESKKPLKQFDLFGFTLPYELCFTNILNMLNLADIPFFSSQRDESYPLIIGGGPGAFNPEPLADFFDLFVLGDGEEVILDLVDLGIQAKKEKWPKSFLLKQMAKLPGIYVPSHFQISYHPDGTIQKIIPLQGQTIIEKIFVQDLNQAFYPTNPVISNAETVHDRFALEIARGCSHGCRFCQAGFLYRPVRERKLETLQTMARESIKHTGYEELSLVSLNSSDYSQLENLLGLLRNDCQTNMVALSLPSLRPGTLTSPIISYIKEIRKTGFTIAPEAGTQRLRNVINKGITEEDIFTTAQKIFEQGWDLIKLYFMIGLPTEQPEDLEGIVSISRKILKLGKSLSKRRANINLTISPFVPKPHTAFQWSPQDPIEILQEKTSILRQRLNHRDFKVKCRNPEVSLLEAAMARGDRRLSQVLKKAWELGSRFDQWSEQFCFSLWEKAFAESNLDITFYANRSIGEKEILPWGHLSSGISPHFFSSEAAKALQEMATPDCRSTHCQGCGVCNNKQMKTPPLPNLITLEKEPIPEQKTSQHIKMIGEAKKQLGQKSCQIRAKFHKKGTAVYMSHLDLMRVFRRAIRRADLPISFSQGFHPLPRISLGLPLPVGIDGLAEYGDFIFRESLNPEEFLSKINKQLPNGIKILQCKNIPLESRSLFVLINCAIYEIKILPGDWENELQHIEHKKQLAIFLGQDEIWIQKKKKKPPRRATGEDLTKKINIRHLIHDISLLKENNHEKDHGFRMSLAIGNESVHPIQVLKSLYAGLIDISKIPVKITRQDQYVLHSNRLWDPLEIL